VVAARKSATVAKTAKRADWYVPSPSECVLRLIHEHRSDHKLVCRSFASLGHRPGSNYYRALYLPANGKKAKLLWVAGGPPGSEASSLYPPAVETFIPGFASMAMSHEKMFTPPNIDPLSLAQINKVFMDRAFLRFHFISRLRTCMRSSGCCIMWVMWALLRPWMPAVWIKLIRTRTRCF
jgi:hypothetical protein